MIKINYQSYQTKEKYLLFTKLSPVRLKHPLRSSLAGGALITFKFKLLISTGKFVLVACNSGVGLSTLFMTTVLTSLRFSSSTLLTPETLGTGSSSGSLLKKKNNILITY